MIKNIEYLKNIQIVCRRNKQDVENCLNMLEELGFEVRNNDNQYKVIFYREYSGMFENDIRLECNKDTYFFDKKFIKILKKFIKEKEEKEKINEKKEKEEDYEVASDGRIIKINNWMSKKQIFLLFSGDKVDGCINRFLQGCLMKYVDLGLVYATPEARDKAVFKMEIETKLKNIAERLNKKIFYVDSNLFKNNIPKYSLSIEYTSSFEKKLHYYSCGNNTIQEQGTIYCLDKNFLDVAKQEIGEENLIKYFTE